MISLSFHYLLDLVQKAKKAKNKLLKRDDDRTDGTSQEQYESYSYGGVDPYMWEPQELGKQCVTHIIENCY